MFNKKMSTSLLISEMDQNVKRMLKLVEEDADSFAKKAEMYYQKRPELLGLVEDFSRMYCSLSERFDHATGELRKNIQSEIQSQSSCISEVLSELPSTCPSPDHRPNRRRSGHRAAGFDFFLGTNITELGYKEGEEPSNLDYESESDAFSVVNDDETTLLRRKIYDLEVELFNTKEKLRLHQEDNSECSSTESRNGNIEAVRPKTTLTTAAYEEEMMEKIQILEKMVSEKCDEVEELTQSLAAITRSHNMVLAEKAKLDEELTAEMSYKDDKIDAMCRHLHELQMEHVLLMSEIEGERKVAEELSSRAKELETKIKEQEEIIQEGAEEKRQAIRQLCFSLEHYRTGYLRLRDVINHMKPPVVET